MEIAIAIIVIAVIVWLWYEIKTAPVLKDEPTLMSAPNMEYEDMCPKCWQKGYKTYLFDGSYTCDECNIYWKDSVD